MLAVCSILLPLASNNLERMTFVFLKGQKQLKDEEQLADIQTCRIQILASMNKVLLEHKASHFFHMLCRRAF